MEEPQRPKEPWLLPKLGLLAGCWLLATYGLGRLGLWLAPQWIISTFSQASYGLVVQMVVTCLGLVLAFQLGLLAHSSVGLVGVRLKSLLVAWLSAPVVFVCSTVISLWVALPTLMQELATKGAGVSRRQAGAMGVALVQTPTWLVVVWSVLMAAVAEEMVFRGALWGALERLFSSLAKPINPTNGAHRCFKASLVSGFGATVVSGVVFGWMHYDLKGGVGLVRLVSSLCLGFVLGTIRHGAGCIWPAVLLHALYNALALAQRRGALPGESVAWLMGLPSSVLWASFLGCLGLLLMAWRKWRAISTKAGL